MAGRAAGLLRDAERLAGGRRGTCAAWSTIVAGTMVAPLTPLDFLARSATVYRDAVAVVDGDRRFTYAEFDARVSRLAGALAGSGGARGGPRRGAGGERGPRFGGAFRTDADRGGPGDAEYPSAGGRIALDSEALRREGAADGLPCSSVPRSSTSSTITKRCSPARSPAPPCRSPTRTRSSRSTTPAAPPGFRRA